MEADRRCASLARDQHGVFSRAQAREAGLARGSVAHRLATGRWEALLPGVFRMAGTGPSWEQDLMAACLYAGPPAAASHRAAATLWGLAGIERGRVEVVSPRRLREPGVLVHRTVVPPERLVSVGPIPVTDPARTLLDLGAVAPPWIVGDALDDALRRRLTDLASLEEVLENDGARGRDGTGVLRRLVAERDPDLAPSESVLESRLASLLRSSTLPPPVPQFEVWEGGRVAARIDFAWPEAMVALEADGYRYHAGKRVWSGDLERRNILTRLGWRVIHATWADVHERPEALLGGTRRALRLAAPSSVDLRA